MTEDLLRAKQLLIANNYTCVIIKDKEVIFTSYERGVKPIYQALERYSDKLQGSSLADKVIGKGAAFLAVQAGIKELFTDILSQNAKTVLEDNKIAFHCNKLVPNILNREGNDLCPVEKLTKEINEPREALSAIRNFIKNMR